MFGNNLQSVDAIVSGELSGNINSIYQDIINNDIVKPSYSDFSRPETFGLVKRRAYKNIFANGDFAQYRITDMAFIPMGNCGEDGYTLYFYTVSPDNTEFRIFKVPMTVEGQIYCINTFINEIATTCHCPCQADNFIKVKGPRGERRPIPDGGGDITSNNGVQVNRTNTTTNITEGRFGEGTYGTFEPRVAGVNYNIGDYVYVYCITGLDDPTKGIAGQVRQIIGYDGATNELILDFPRNLTPDNVLSTALSTGYAASYSVFSEWGEVLVFASCEGLYSLHPVEDEEAILPICDSNTTNDACITTLNYHNGQIHYTNDRGRDVYSETGQNQFAFEGTNVSPVPNAILNQVSFRNHLVYFSYSTIGVLYPTTSNNEAYASVGVSETVGLWSRYSFVADDNQLLIVTNQRRLKALSIIQNKDSQPEIKLEDITSYFNGELDNLEFGDQVYINKVGKELRIHIVGRQTADDNETIEKRTKILILDTEYNVYHKHTVCNGEVTTYLGYGLYGGSGVFSRCGYEDGGMPDEEGDMVGTKYYTQTISTILGQNGFPALEFNTFNPKRLKYLKTMLGPSILTNGDSEVKYISNRNGMKPERVMNDWENITWIDAWNRIKAGEQIPVSLCFTDDLQECETLNDSCPNGIEPEPEPTICNCPTEYKNQSNYCNCYVNPGYFLADIYPLEIKRITNFAETIKVEWNAKQGNSMYFMGFAALVEKGQIIDDVYDNNNLENENCCARPEIFYTNSNGDEYTCGQPLIGWNPVQGSASYQVKEGATILGTNTDPEFQISGATAGNHTYTILAYDGVEYYEIGSVLINILLTCLPLAPETFTLDPEYDCGDPTVNRSEVEDAESYNIYEGVTLLGNYVGLTTTLGGQTAGTHTYTVYAVNDAGESTEGTDLTFAVGSCVEGNPILGLVAENDNGSAYTCGQPNLDWDDFPLATSYKVYEGVTLKETSTSSSCSISLASLGAHTYTVTAYNGATPISDPTNITVTVLAPCSVPPNVSLPPTSKYDADFIFPYSCGTSIGLAWITNHQATEYRVYEGATLLATINSSPYNEVVLTGQSLGAHTYTIKACNSLGCSSGTNISATIVSC